MSEIIGEAGGEERIQQGSVRDLYSVFFRHKWKMVLFFLTVTIIVAVGTLLAAEIYRSEAKLLMRLGRESVSLDPTATTGQTINVSQSRKEQINSELEILKSQELAENVVDSIGAAAFLNRPDEQLPTDSEARETVRKTRREVRTAVRAPRSLLERLDLVDPIDDRTEAVLIFMKNLDVEAVKDSSIISISYEAQSRRLARDALAKLIDLYMERHVVVHNTPGSYEFFVRQCDDLRDKLALAESELRDVKNALGVSSLEEQRLVLLNRIGALEQLTGDAETEQAVSKAKVEEMQRVLAGLAKGEMTGETTGFSDYGTDLMRSKLFELQLKEQDLASRYTEDSEQVKMIRQEVAEAQALLSKERVNSIHKQVESDLLTEQVALSSLQAKVENLKGQLTTAQAELRVVNDADFKITQLLREIDTQKANYAKYSNSLEQARIDQALEAGNISNISIVQSATLPNKSIRPRKKLNLALGVMLGIFGAIGLAFLSEYMDHSIRTPKEVEERLRLPTLASIPRVRANRIVPVAKLRKAKAGNRSPIPWKSRVRAVQLKRTTAGNGFSEMWSIPVQIRKPYAGLAEQLFLSSNGSTKKPRVLAIVSCYRGEGVSTVAANLSASLAQQVSGDVLLVDVNTARPARPSVHRIFRNSQGKGDAILASSEQKLPLLAVGSKNMNLPEIFDLGRFTTQLSSLKQPYDFVVLALPAVSQASYVPRLSSLCDDVIIVVEAERLRWEVVQRTKEQLSKSQTNLLGVVLNKRRFHIPDWLYQTL